VEAATTSPGQAGSTPLKRVVSRNMVLQAVEKPERDQS